MNMNTLLRKKEVTIGLGIALLVAVGYIIYITFIKEDYAPPAPQPRPQPLPQPTPQRHPSEVESVVGQNKPTLVLFYANWCGHSKNMLGDWKKAKENLLQSGQFDVLDFSQEEHGQEMAKHGIQGFPAVRLYPEGFPSAKFIEYKGDRSANSFLKFVHSEGQDA